MYQSITLVGSLGRDPELKYSPSGTPICSMSVATNRKYTGSDGQLVKETLWFRVSVFGKQAEASAQYLKKGSSVLVEGRLTGDIKTGGPKTFTKKDGGLGTSFEVAANTVRFLSKSEAASMSDSGGSDPIHGEDSSEVVEF